MPKGDKLTIKQRKFIKAYVETGNQTQSALKVYNTTDPDTAHSIAQETLQKVPVQQELDRILSKKGLRIEDLADNVKNIATISVDKASADSVLRANELLLKLHNAFPGSKHSNINFNIRGKMKDLSFQDAKRELEKLNSQIGEVVEDPTT